MERPSCPKCGAEPAVKNGCVQKVQRWKCGDCGFQFTRSLPRGRPLMVKLLSFLLYRLGMTMQAIGRVFGVSDVAVLKWIRQIPLPVKATGPPEGEIVILERIWPYIRKNRALFSSEKSWIVCQAEFLPESVGIIILPPLSRDH